MLQSPCQQHKPLIFGIFSQSTATITHQGGAQSSAAVQHYRISRLAG
jgi:hypothetical protein